MPTLKMYLPDDTINRKLLFIPLLFCMISLFCSNSSGWTAITPDMQNVMVPMRDGTRLATDIYLPDGDGNAWSVVLGRTPYGKTNLESGSIMLPENAIQQMNLDGIAVVIQDVRGRYNSEGTTIPFISDGWGEDQDGFDTQQWVSNQIWCNGQIATIGASAGGLTQIFLAGTGPQSLCGQWIGLAPCSAYHSFAYIGGSFRKELVDGWLTSSQWPIEPNLKLIREHFTYDPYWQPQNLSEEGRAEKVNWPVVIAAGWYDLFLDSSLDLYQRILERGQTTARNNVHLIIGPYTHTAFGQAEQGELTYPNSGLPYDTLLPTEQNWLYHWLLDTPLNPSPPRVVYYVMGESPDNGAPGNEWRSATKWPPQSTEKTFFLTLDNRLSVFPVSSTGEYHYQYDPANAVPTLGGQNFMFPLNAPSGPFDQASLENRSDDNKKITR